MLTSPVRWISTLAALVTPAVSAFSQGPGPSQRFTVGGRDIVRVDFASTPIGDFPSNLEMVDGIIDVVAMNGRNMLRASSRSVIRVPLPQVLPQDFTLEFEIIPKAGGNPEDLAIEGTPLINQGANSANVMWHRDYLQIVGGGATYDSKVPPTFAATLPSVLTQVVLSLQGETMKLWTNGRLMYTQSNRKFVRGRVLRVFLGGQDDGPNAVYLASLRVVDGVAVAPVVAGGAPGGTNPTGASAGDPGPAPVRQSSNPVPTPRPDPPNAPPVSQLPTTPPSITMIVAPALPWGARINWTDVPGAAFWELERGEGQQTPSVLFSVEASSRRWVAGVTEDSDQLVLAGRQYTYRIKALAADRSVIASAQQNFATPANYPVIPGLTATPGPLTTLNVGPNAVAMPARLVTWTWDRNALGDGALYATTDLFSSDPTGQATGLGTRWPESSQAYGMNATLAVATGMTVRFCASVARGSLGDLLSPTCLDTPVTGGLNAATTLGPPSTGTATPITPPPLTAAPVSPATATPIQPPPTLSTAPNATMPHSDVAMRRSGCNNVSTGGPATATITRTASTPVGASLVWAKVAGAFNYVIDRARSGTTTWELIGSTCGGPSPVIERTNDMEIHDRTGGTPTIIGTTRTYIYRVTALGPNGEAGWNTENWTVPCMRSPTPTATVSGSTVTLTWSGSLGSCGVYRSTTAPDHYNVTSSFGYSKNVTGTSIDVLGVPVGTHTFAVTARWNPDGRSQPGQKATVVVKY